jgi:hypothetical protein
MHADDGISRRHPPNRPLQLRHQLMRGWACMCVHRKAAAEQGHDCRWQTDAHASHIWPHTRLMRVLHIESVGSAIRRLSGPGMHERCTQSPDVCGLLVEQRCSQRAHLTAGHLCSTMRLIARFYSRLVTMLHREPLCHEGIQIAQCDTGVDQSSFLQTSKTIVQPNVMRVPIGEDQNVDESYTRSTHLAPRTTCVKPRYVSLKQCTKRDLAVR